MKRLRILLLLSIFVCIGGCGNKDKPKTEKPIEAVDEVKEKTDKETKAVYLDTYLELFGYVLTTEPKCYRYISTAADNDIDLTEFDINNNSMEMMHCTLIEYVGADDIWYTLTQGNTAALAVRKDGTAVLAVEDLNNYGCCIICDIGELTDEGESINYELSEDNIESRLGMDEKTVKSLMWGNTDVKLTSREYSRDDLNIGEVPKNFSKSLRKGLKGYLSFSNNVAAIADVMKEIPGIDKAEFVDVYEPSNFGAEVTFKIEGKKHRVFSTYTNLDGKGLVVWYEVFN